MAELEGDWIKLHRRVLDSDLFADDWLTRLWIWCLCKANFREATFRGEAIERGQFVTGRITAADELGVSPSKWYRGISKLCEMKCISTTSNSNWTTITVCRYEDYQNTTSKSEQVVIQRVNSQRTADDTTSEQPADTIEEEQELKKGRREEGKKETPVADAPVLPFRCPEFLEAWTDFVAMRSEIRKPLKLTSTKLCFAKLLAMGREKAIQSLKDSTAAQWQGLFDPKTDSRSNGNGQSDPRGNFAARESFLKMMGDR